MVVSLLLVNSLFYTRLEELGIRYIYNLSDTKVLYNHGTKYPYFDIPDIDSSFDILHGLRDIINADT